MTAAFAQFGLFVAYALVGGSIAFVLATGLDRFLPLSGRIRQFLYLAVLIVPLMIYMIHTATLCSATSERVLPAICLLTAPYSFWLGVAGLLLSLPVIKTVSFTPYRKPAWRNTDAKLHVDNLIASINARPISIRLIDSEYPQAFVEGWLNPVIYLTRGLYQELDEYELKAVLEHEVAHVRGGDNLLNIAAVVMRSLTALSPLSHLAYYRYVEAREQAADETVDDALDLASALVKVSRREAGLQLVLGSCLGSDGVTSRIETLLTRSVKTMSVTWVQASLLLSLALVLFIC